MLKNQIKFPQGIKFEESSTQGTVSLWQSSTQKATIAPSFDGYIWASPNVEQDPNIYPTKRQAIFLAATSITDEETATKFILSYDVAVIMDNIDTLQATLLEKSMLGTLGNQTYITAIETSITDAIASAELIEYGEY